jgi:hypothetical protein
MKARVIKEGLDWVAKCDVHDTWAWCGDWEIAYEAAVGHVAMWHPRNLDTQLTTREGESVMSEERSPDYDAPIFHRSGCWLRHE